MLRTPVAAGQAASRRRLLLALQAAVLLFGVAAASTSLSFMPRYHDMLVSQCLLHGCGSAGPAPPTTEAQLRAEGLALPEYAGWFVAIDGTFTFLFAAAALIIGFKGRHEPMALLASAMLASFGATFPQLAHTATQDLPFWPVWFAAIGAAGWIALFYFFGLFPEGRFKPRWTAVPVTAFAAVKLLGVWLPDTPFGHDTWPLAAAAALFAIPAATLAFSLFHRYRRTPSQEQKQMIKWIVYGFAVALSGFLAVSLLFEPGLFESATVYVYLNGLLHVFLLAIPLTLCLAILRRRLWAVDPVVNRTIVYVSLSACVAAIYALIVALAGTVMPAEDRFLPSLLSTVVVAMLFAPLRNRLQMIVDRLLKGRHDDPYGTLAELRRRLAEPLAPEAMLDALVRVVRESLRIPYAAVTVVVNGRERFASSDSSGEPPAEAEPYPIVHRGQEVGVLLAAHRPGEPFSAADIRLLDVLLGHAGPIVDNYLMTRGMKLLADDLQHSREKLVLAREEERRTIRRNLHDELAPRLAALGLNATAAEMNVKRDPVAAAELLAELRRVIRSTVEDIRTLVHGMRPASLDEWGLAGALQERIRELTKPVRVADRTEGPAAGLRIDLDMPAQLPELPAAIEVAAYWIVSEAIANVVRHAQATECRVELAMKTARELTIAVTDNGIGLDERRVGKGTRGIGIASMRERAAELGGDCTVVRMAAGGTRVAARIPVAQE